MKKVLFSLLIGVSLFIFPNFLIQAKAEIIVYEIEYKPEDNPHITDEVKEKLTEIFNYWNENFSEYKYISTLQTIFTKNDWVYIKFNKTDKEDHTLSLKGSLYQNKQAYLNWDGFSNKGDNYKCWISFSIENIDTFIEKLKKATSPNDLADHTDGTYLQSFESVSEYHSQVNNNGGIISTNISNLKFKGIDRSSFVDLPEDVELQFIYHNKLLNSEEIFPNDFLDMEKPKITISHENITVNNTIVAMTIKTNFSIFERGRYIYEYSIDSTKNEDFIEIKNNDFKIKIENDCNIFFRVLDRNTGEFITSATFNAIGIQKFQYDGKTYRNFIKIPITELYDYQNNVWKKKQIVFLADTQDGSNPVVQFYFQMSDKDITTTSNPIPITIYVNNSILDLNEYLDKVVNSPTSDPDGYGGGFSVGGGTFGGGSGGGRFDDDEDSIKSCTLFPQKLDLKMDSFYHYAVVTFNPNFCSDLTNKRPEDFTTDSIYIFYNGKKYDTVIDAIDDNIFKNDTENLFDHFNGLVNENGNSIKQILDEIWNYFKNSKISTYILILITGTIIILVISGTNR